MPSQQQRQHSDELLCAARDNKLWISPPRPSYGPTAKSALNDMDKLPPPRKPIIGKGVAPELLCTFPPTIVSPQDLDEQVTNRSSSRVLNDRQKKLKAMIKHIITSLMASHGDNILDQLAQMPDSPTNGSINNNFNYSAKSILNSSSQEAPSLYIIRQIIPVLLPAIESLLRHSVHVAESRRLGSDRRAVHPTDWLASYLMRHNPRHQHQSSLGETGYAEEAVQHQQEEVNLLSNAVVAELLTANKAKQRSESWKNRNAERVAELWENFCPQTKSELTIEDVRGALSEISKLLGYEDGIVDAEGLFSLMDKDKSGGVDFGEFESALSNYLQEAERFGDMLLRGKRGKELVRGWAYKAARTLFNSRLQQRNIHARALFDKHSLQPERGVIGFVGLVKAIGEVTDLLYEQKKTERPELSPGLAQVDRSVTMDFDEFARTVAKEVDHAARQAEEMAQARARAVAEKRAMEDAHEQEELMASADRVSKGIKEADVAQRDATIKITEIKKKCEQANEFIEKTVADTVGKVKTTAIAKKWIEQLELVSRNAGTEMKRTLKDVQEKGDHVNARRKDAHMSFELLKSKIRACSRMQTVVVRKAEIQFVAFSSSVRDLTANIRDTKERVDVLVDATMLRAQLVERISQVSATWTSMCKRAKTVLGAIEKSGDEVLMEEGKVLNDYLTDAMDGLFGSRESTLRKFSSPSGAQAALRRVENLTVQLEYANSNLCVMEQRSGSISLKPSKSEVQNEKEVPSKEENDSHNSKNMQTKEETKEDEKKSDKNRQKKRPTVPVKKGAVTGAAKSGNINDLAQIISNGADPNERDKNGSTALVHLAWPGNIKGVRVLLEHGADPLIANLRKNNCMHFAFEREHEELIKLLLVNGGREALNAKNSLGKTPEMLNAGLAHLVQWVPTEIEIQKYLVKKSSE